MMPERKCTLSKELIRRIYAEPFVDTKNYRYRLRTQRFFHKGREYQMVEILRVSIKDLDTTLEPEIIYRSNLRVGG